MRRILCYGDSNTFGYNPHSYWGEPYPDDTRWTGILQSNGWDVANCGQNGREIPASEGELCAVERLISAAMPVDIVTVLLGSNDFLTHPHFTAENVTARMETLLRRILKTNWEIQVLLIAPPPFRAGEWVPPDTRIVTESVRLAPRYRALAGRLGVSFADAGAWNVALDFDGVHFRPEGHAAFAKGLMEALKTMPEAVVRKP
ncbi:MAG: hypothetical protein IJK52_13115 [Oscillospiraceae bacterium]|nr:hypothetical protein [Oscillospiraceae bacterium]